MKEIELAKFLPHSGQRYVVHLDGRITDRDSNPIPTVMKDDELFVELSWIHGKQLYSVGALVIVCFHPMFLPDHLWIEIEPLYRDGNSENNHSDNLVYRFRNGPLPVEGYRTFYYVPFYTQYGIDRFGTLINTNNGRENTWHQVKPDLIRNSTGGYWATRVAREKKVSRVLLRHRALCLTFKFYDATTVNNVVNHENGVPGDDDLDNLKWSTYSVNNKHAHDSGLTGRRRYPVLVKNLKTGKIDRYNNTKETATALGFSSTAAVRYRLRHAQDVLFSDYLAIKWDDDKPWLDIDMDSVPVVNYPGTVMAAKNIYTDEIVTFTTFEEGSRLTGVDKQTIMIHVRDNQIMPYSGYNFSYYTKGMEWPVHSDWNLEVYRKYPVDTPDSVTVLDTHTGDEKRFYSRNEAAVYLECSLSYVSNSLGRRLIANRYKLSQYKLRDHITVPSDWKV